MGVLEGLEPARVFDFFEQISNIPRGSGNTAAMLDYLKNFAQERKLESRADSAGNIVIYAKGTPGYEKSSPVILQGHMDMVCAKRPDVGHDFTKDGLDLTVDGDWLYAEGTSLGGDDGAAVAMMLAVLDDNTIPHPPLECVFTTDEEIGLIGAEKFDCSALKGRTMINLDSEEEGVFTCGCAGGARVDTILAIEKNKLKGLPVLVTIAGLRGGHSGSKIGECRANADKLMGRLLNGLLDIAAYSLESVSGGDKDNAIPYSAKAHLVADEEDYPLIEKYAEKFQRDARAEYAGIDDGITVTVEKGVVHRMDVLTPDSQDRVIRYLMFAPQGVRMMSGTVKGLIETSSNLGIVRTGDKEFAATESVRSSVGASRRALTDEIRALSEMLGGSVHVSGEYPAWEFRQESRLRDLMIRKYREVSGGKEPVIDIIHAGLECGLFAGRIRGLDAVSIGPDMKDIHTSDEKLSISSTARTFELLKAVLEALK